MNKKSITISVEEARKLLGKNEEVDVLLRSTFTEEEMKKVANWRDLPKVDGYYINNNSDFRSFSQSDDTPDVTERNIFATKNQVRSALAMSQLSQLMKHVNGDWVPDWTKIDTKYVIYAWGGAPAIGIQSQVCSFLAFPTAQIRDQFLQDHRELIEEFFLMYKYD